MKYCPDKGQSKKEIQVMKVCKSVIAALATSVLLAGISGCQDGPAERAGKKIVWLTTSSATSTSAPSSGAISTPTAIEPPERGEAPSGYRMR
jgi:hypothetical protein